MASSSREEAVLIGIEAVKGAFLLNGAAAVALLGFLASTSATASHSLMVAASCALVKFSIGAACAPLSYVCSYIAVHAQNGGLGSCIGWKWFQGSALLFGFTPVIFFVWAVLAFAPALALP